MAYSSRLTFHLSNSFGGMDSRRGLPQDTDITQEKATREKIEQEVR